MVIKTIARNPKASHDYHLFDRFEAGIVLTGSEIKSIRAGKVSIKEAYVRIINDEAWLLNAHISSYDPAFYYSHKPRRNRKLLLNRFELRKIEKKVFQRGMTIVPLQIYIKNGRAKLEISIAKGKKLYDKRHALAKKDTERRIQRFLSNKKK